MSDDLGPAPKRWPAGSLAHTVIRQFFHEGRSVEAMTDLLDGVDRVEIIENIIRALALGKAKK